MSNWNELVMALGIAAVAAMGVACGDDGRGGDDAGMSDAAGRDTGTADTGTADTGTADTGTADTGTADTGTADTGTADTGTADTGTADAGDPDPTCENYCDVVTAHCTDGNAQYADRDACMSYCNDAVSWGTGTRGDTTGNSLACRVYHGNMPASMDPETHCPHAGPSGGDFCGSWCENYCQLALDNCTGEDVLYASMDECMTFCDAMPDDGTANDTTGNSVQCRIYHSGAPAAADSGLHCPHAGPTGGDFCGSWCEVYCQLAMDHCTGDNALYESVDACMTACDGFADTGSPGDTTGDTVQCRIYHAGASAAGTDPATHCPHSGETPTEFCLDT